MLETLITCHDDVVWGTPVIAGTRVPVATLFEYLERGKDLEEFLAQFPTVSHEKAVAIVELAKGQVLEHAATG